MQTGRVKFFDTKKGFGFITPDNSGDDVFVHYTGIKLKSMHGRKNLKDGELVQFETQQGIKGMQAVNVESV